MSPEQQLPSERPPPSDRQAARPLSDEVPALEDASEPDAPKPEVVPDDEVGALDPAARALESSVAGAPEEGDSLTRPLTATGPEDSDSDTYGLVGTSDEPPAEPSAPPPPRQLDWEYEASAHSVVVELKRVELEVRQMLDERDTRRKRKLGGTYRWRELEDDIRSWRYSGRFDEAALDRLSQLVNRRHHLFRRLRFLASTRPTWNT